MAPATARVALESLLRDRRLDNTLTSSLPIPPADEDRVAASGMAALDDLLLGGVPRGQISEITGARSSGRTSLLLSLLAAATRRGEVVALVDALDRLDPASAEAAGVRLDQLLWVRGHDVPLTRRALSPDWEPSRPRPGRSRASLIDRAVDRAIKATNLIVQAGGFGLVAVDLGDVPATVIGALPFTTWMRLQRVLEGSDTACLILSDQQTTRSAGGVSVRLESRAAGWSDTATPSPQARVFHEAVMASRRPFVRGTGERRIGRWSGPATCPRRLQGLSVRASVVRAQRRQQSTEHVALDFGD
jgi:hypothetical protein